MDVILADHNDRKSVWVWIQDDLFKPFITNCGKPLYKDHKKWFDLMCNKKNIAIGIEQNLRFGFSFVNPLNENRIQVNFFKKNKTYQNPNFNLGRKYVVVLCIFPHNQVHIQPRIDFQFRSLYT